MLTKMIMTMMMSQMRLKRNNLTTNGLNCLIKQIKSQNQMKKQKNFWRLKIKKKDQESKLTALQKCQTSKNDFNKAIKLIKDIKTDTNNFKPSSGDKKVFNDLNEQLLDEKYYIFTYLFVNEQLLDEKYYIFTYLFVNEQLLDEKYYIFTYLFVKKSIITKNQEKMAKILSLLKEILDPSNKKSDEQLDTTDMSELESEESASERRNQQGQGLKILTADQILNRLPITLVQLKAGNDSQNLINEIRKLLYK